MPYHFDFDSTNQILRGRFEGRVINEELRNFYQIAGHLVAKICPRAGITDFASVTSLEVSPETIRDLASLPPAMPDPVQPRVIVAPTPDIFGLARMFQLEGEQTRPNLHVVRKLGEACAILGAHDLKFKPIRQDDQTCGLKP